MKKTIVTWILMLLVIPMYSQKGEYYIKEGRSKSLHYGRYIEDFGGSVYIGSMNLPSIGSEMIGGFECTIWNFYFDYMGAALGHSKSVNVGNWENQKTGSTFHFGYRLSIYRNFAITPIIGRATMEIGTVDGYDYSVDNEGNIINSFNVEGRESKQDYGAIISYDFGSVRDNHTDCCLKLSFGLTKYCIWGGIGFSLK